jgi:Cu(I)/Ag(I) efflux system membrane fusion protein
MMKPRGIAAIVLAAALLAGAIPTPWGCGDRGGGTTEKGAAPEAKYYCPMHPQIVSDRPGDCSVCNMRLVPQDAPHPVYSNGVTADGGGPEGYATITIDPAKQQLIGLKLAPVTRGPFATTLRTVGRVEFDETRVHHVHTRYEGYIEQVFADFTGKVVRKGEPLASIYSPDLLATQEEFLLSLRAAQSATASGGDSAGAWGIVEAARRRLRLWEINSSDIAELERTGEPSVALKVYAPITGVVTERTAYHGMKVGPDDTLFDLADLSSVWVQADIYEYEMQRVSVGQHASMTLAYSPGRTWRGQVRYVYPMVDEKARTVRVRLEFENRDGELKPGMFADVVIEGLAREALSVPDDAVLDSGVRKIVFVALGGGRLEAREVETGDRTAGTYEIRSGLAEGESVAVGANFLLDSESRLRAAIAAAGARAGDSLDTNGAAAGHGGRGGGQ